MKAPCIAVIDDDDAILDMTEHILALDGYRCLCFRSAADATTRLREHQPELVLIDLHLERPTAGLELVAALQQDPATAHIPIVVWSADPQVGTTVARRQLTGVVVLHKPVLPHALLCLVAALSLVR